MNLDKAYNNFFNNNIYLQENRAYEFLPLQSRVQKIDKVTVPNIPFIIADRKISGLGWSSFTAKAFINSLTPRPQPFLVRKTFLKLLSKRF